MRYSTVFIFIFSLLLGKAFSQCTPSPLYSSGPAGIWPDSAAGLPFAYTGEVAGYNAVIDVRTLTDTTDATAGAIKVYAMRINPADVTGMPPGFSFSPNYSGTTGWVNGGTAPALTQVQGCVLVSGTQASVISNANGGPASNGIFPLIVKVDMKITTTLLTTPFWISTLSTLFPLPVNDNYQVKIVNNTAVVELNSPLAFSVSQNFPNPSGNNAEVNVTMPEAGNIDLKLFDLLGNCLSAENHFLPRGESRIALGIKNIPPGIYFYSATNGSATASHRLIVSEK